MCIRDRRYTVIEAPVNGQIEFATGPGIAINSFTQADVDNNLVVFRHDGSETLNDEFRFTVDDAQGTVSVGRLDIVINPVNDAPTVDLNLPLAVSESDSAPILNTTLAVNDVDSDADDVTLTITSGPTNGRLELASAPGVAVTTVTKAQIDNGELLYFHDGTETVNDSFTFDVFDNDGGVLNSQTFQIDVNQANDAPVATDDLYNTDEDASLTANVLSNDIDGDGDSLVVTLVSGPANSETFQLNPDGTFTYSPLANYNGTDSFVYQVSDGQGGVSSATVTLDIAPVNDLPEAVAEQFVAVVGDSFTSGGSLLGNDADTEGDALVAVLVTPPANGVVALRSDGTFVFTSEPGFVGRTSFTYVANDGFGNSEPVTVEIDVVNVADPVQTIGNMDPIEDDSDEIEEMKGDPLNEVEESDSDVDTSITPESENDGGVGDSLIDNVVGLDDDRNLADDFFRGNDEEAVETEQFDLNEFEENIKLLANLTNKEQATLVLDRLLAEGEEIVSLEEEQAARGPSVTFDVNRLLGISSGAEDDGGRGVTLGDLKVRASTVSLLGGAGYILWTLRGGVLVATALSSTPTWEFINPAALLKDEQEKTLGKYFR